MDKFLEYGFVGKFLRNIEIKNKIEIVWIWAKDYPTLIKVALKSGTE